VGQNEIYEVPRPDESVSLLDFMNIWGSYLLAKDLVLEKSHLQKMKKLLPRKSFLPNAGL
jgi:hypothetical protein